MIYALMGYLHAAAAQRVRAIRDLAGRERGQGTVEYVGLILLVAVILAGVVQASGGLKDSTTAEGVLQKTQGGNASAGGGGSSASSGSGGGTPTGGGVLQAGQPAGRPHSPHPPFQVAGGGGVPGVDVHVGHALAAGPRAGSGPEPAPPARRADRRRARRGGGGGGRRRAPRRR